MAAIFYQCDWQEIGVTMEMFKSSSIVPVTKLDRKWLVRRMSTCYVGQ